MFDQRVKTRVVNLIGEAKSHILSYYPESIELLSVFQFFYKPCTPEDFSKITFKHAPKKKELPWAFTFPRVTSPLIQMKYSPDYEVLTGKLGMEAHRDTDIYYNENKLIALKEKVEDKIFEAFLLKITIHELLEPLIRSLPMNWITDPEDMHAKVYVQTELVFNSVKEISDNIKSEMKRYVPQFDYRIYDVFVEKAGMGYIRKMEDEFKKELASIVWIKPK